MHAFACPELISIARKNPEALLILSSQISTHEARTIDWVNIPLKILPSGASINAKSFLLDAFKPADIPAKRNPLGVTLLSSTNDQLESNWLDLFGILIHTNYSLILKKQVIRLLLIIWIFFKNQKTTKEELA